MNIKNILLIGRAGGGKSPLAVNLDSVRQNSQSRINHAQQQINNAERNLEQQIQQQTGLSGPASLIGSIAKMFI